jgi:integrase
LFIHKNDTAKYIQKQMRHSSIQVTFDTYGHLFPETKQAATLKLDAAIMGLS